METTDMREKVMALIEKADKQTLEVVYAVLINSRANLDDTNFPETVHRLILGAIDEGHRTRTHPKVIADSTRKRTSW